MVLLIGSRYESTNMLSLFVFTYKMVFCLIFTRILGKHPHPQSRPQQRGIPSDKADAVFLVCACVFAVPAIWGPLKRILSGKASATLRKKANLSRQDPLQKRTQKSRSLRNAAVCTWGIKGSTFLQSALYKFTRSGTKYQAVFFI